MKMSHSIFRHEHKPNHCIYALMTVIDIVLMLILFIVPQESVSYVIISGITSGGIASIVVAWLIDASNCRSLNLRDDNIRLYQFLNLIFDIEQLFEIFPQLANEEWISHDDYNGKDRTWFKWLKYVQSKRTKNRVIYRRDLFKRLSGNLIKQIEEIENKKIELLLEQIITENEMRNLVCLKHDFQLLEHAIYDLEEDGLLIALIKEIRILIRDTRLISFFNEVEYSPKNYIRLSAL